MADDLAAQLEQFLKQVEKRVPDRKTKLAMTKAGAEVLKQELTAVAKAKHYSNKKDPVYGHMADNISVAGKNIDGIKDGTAVVGWKYKGHAMNAVYTNDGTVRTRGDFWYDNTVRESKVAVFEAEKKVYEAMTK